MRTIATIVAPALLALLTACGGGGGDDEPETPQEQAAALLRQQRDLYAQMLPLCPTYATGGPSSAPCPAVPASIGEQFNALSDKINELWPVPQSPEGVSCYDMAEPAKGACMWQWQSLTGLWRAH